MQYAKAVTYLYFREVRTPGTLAGYIQFNRTEILQIVYNVDKVIRLIANVFKKRWKDNVDTVSENIVEYSWNYKPTE